MPKSKQYEQKKEPTFEIGSGNIFKDLGFSDDEAVNMFARGQLALEIRDIIEKNGWTQRRAAKEIGVPQPRIAEIMKMRIEHYSIDMLLKYLDKLGWRVSFTLERKNKVA
jgi:predicted XRE-type DNA-binding protein